MHYRIVEAVDPEATRVLRDTLEVSKNSRKGRLESFLGPVLFASPLAIAQKLNFLSLS